MVQSRCGLLCQECGYREQMNCPGCVKLDNPFWGSCPVKGCSEARSLEHCGGCTDFPCDLLNGFAYDKEQGDDGQRIKQCGIWREEGEQK